MARIRNAKESHESGYERILGDKEISNLITKIHATMISAGSELERLLYEEAKNKIEDGEDLDAYFKGNKEFPENDGIYLVNKRTIKKSKALKSDKEPDFLGVDFKKSTLYIIEVKDGENFDTKKSSVEHENLISYRDFIAHKIPFSSVIYICLFNTKDKDRASKAGLKSKFSKEEIITGKEFCDLFNIDFNRIQKRREEDVKDNLRFIIENVKQWLRKYIKPVREESDLRKMWDDLISKNGYAIVNYGEWFAIKNEFKQWGSEKQKVRIVAQANAGEALYAPEADLLGYLFFDDMKKVDIQNDYAIRVDGDSMNKRKINGKYIENSDYVLVQSDTPPEEGDVVVSLVNGGVNIKEVYRENEDVILRSQSKSAGYEDIRVREDDYTYLGRAIDVFKV